MLKIRSYKYRLYPNENQESFFMQNFYACKFVFNKILTDRKAAAGDIATIESERIYPSYYKTIYPFLKSVDSLALAMEERRLNAKLHESWEYAHNHGKKIEYPQFKSKKASKLSYTTCLVNDNIRIDKEAGLIRLPKLKQAVKIVYHRDLPEDYKIKAVTISKDKVGRYWASINFEYEDGTRKDYIKLYESKCTSISYLGKCGWFISDSQGRKVRYPDFYGDLGEKLQKENRVLSRMQFGSNNYKKQVDKINKIYTTIYNRRIGWLNSLANEYCNKFDYIFIQSDNDDFDIGQMINADGTRKMVYTDWKIFRDLIYRKQKDRRHVIEGWSSKYQDPCLENEIRKQKIRQIRSNRYKQYIQNHIDIDPDVYEHNYHLALERWRYEKATAYSAEELSCANMFRKKTRYNNIAELRKTYIKNDFKLSED